MNDENTWKSILADNVASSTVELARKVAGTFANQAEFETGLRTASEQSPYFGWSAFNHSELALLYGALHRSNPDIGYNQIAHNQLLHAVQNNQTVHSISLYGGLTQLGMVAFYLGHPNGLYKQLLLSIDSVVNQEGLRMVENITEQSIIDGLAFTDYDLIQGITGVAVYLLTRFKSGQSQEALVPILQSLVSLVKLDQFGVFKLKTPKDKIVGVLSAESEFEHGLVNCGLSHGISGVLAILSLAKQEKIEIDNLEDSIQRISLWLEQIATNDSMGASWPQAVGLDASGSYLPTRTASMDAWCYGSAGVSRSLWLAGTALDCVKLQNLAIASMKASLKRILTNGHSIVSPTLCHGLSGALIIALRFYNETKDKEFRSAANKIHELIIQTYSSSAKFGFQDIEGCSTKIDNPGFLTGASGVALALLAASTNVEPIWDRLLLIS